MSSVWLRACTGWMQALPENFEINSEWVEREDAGDDERKREVLR